MQNTRRNPYIARVRFWFAVRSLLSFDLISASQRCTGRDTLPQVRRHVAALPARISANACDGGAMRC